MRRTLFAICLFISLCSISFADGKFYAVANSPYPPSPGAQTALIVHADGQETLTVESSMESGAGDSFAWVLPTPDAPTSISASTPGAIRTMRVCATPMVVDYVGVGKDPLIAVGGISALCLVMLGYIVRAKLTGRGSFGGLLVLVAVFAIVSAAMVPNFLGTADQAAADSQLLHRERVGNYDVAVVKGRDAAALDAWMAKNGFGALPDDSRNVITDYCSKGWAFAVAKLVRSASGPLAPHPIQLTFASRDPVYPMRLTGVTTNTVEVDLYVAARAPVEHPLFETRLADRIERATHRSGAQAVCLTGASKEIAHPGLVPLLPPGYWLTHLHAKLQPGQMAEDITLTTKNGNARPVRTVLYTANAAARRKTAGALGAVTAGVILLALMIAAGMRGWRAIVLAVAGIAVLATAAYRLTGVNVIVTDHEPTYLPSRALEARLVSDLRYSHTQITTGSLESAVAAYVLGMKNPYTGGLMEIGDGPGECRIEKNLDGKVAVVLTGPTGAPRRVLVGQ